MQYLILIYQSEAQSAAMPPEQMQAVLGEYHAYSQAVRDEGVARGGNALMSTSSARSVRVRDGERIVTDGPFAETREQLGGYYLVECDDEAQALDVAARCPGARYGTVELRPIWEVPAEA